MNIPTDLAEKLLTYLDSHDDPDAEQLRGQLRECLELHKQTSAHPGSKGVDEVGESSLEALNAAIQNNNPFDRELVVRKTAIWGKRFPDLPSLHAHASDAVFEAIEEIRSGQRQAIGITIKGDNGPGKTHLISRIRHHLQEEEDTLFVYMDSYADLNNIQAEFLLSLASSLKQSGQAASQWQELAAAFVNEALDKTHTPLHLANRLAEHLADRPSIIDELTEQVLETRPEMDDNPDLVRALLWTLSRKHTQYAANWLGGKTLTKRAADTLGLPANPGTDTFERIRQLLDLIGIHKMLVICFDSLDIPGTNDSGLTAAQCIIGLAKDLYNSIDRGVILTAIYPATLKYQIKALPNAEEIMERVGERIYELNGLDPDSMVELVGFWLQDFYEQQGLTPPHPLYPFNEGTLRNLGRERPNTRMVLKWCQENWLSAL